MTESLYDRIGGDAALTAAVDIFYVKILGDADLAPFFEGIDMNRQKRKQKAFLTYAFGGTSHYDGLSMRAAHKKAVEEKGLGEKHFGLVAGHLQSTLEELDVPKNLIDEVMTIAASTHDDVLNL